MGRGRERRREGKAEGERWKRRDGGRREGKNEIWEKEKGMRKEERDQNAGDEKNEAEERVRRRRSIRGRDS